ncbi:hypothetical protein EB796_017999 [Bugula neritina]|uniref:WDR49 n=1 Tax=Bugula neritina TaxID=10212 RepID=A0A7J7JCN5_BUGNE|nr:hypothetical protein EB796_017999 [Bugula neritina]
MIEIYHLYGLNNVPHCLAYYYKNKDNNEPSMLMWGDDAGDVHILEFLAPQTQLFEKAFTKQATKQTKNRIYMQDLLKHSRFVQHTVVDGIHKGEPIKRIKYVSHNDLIITGSASPKTSVVIIDRAGNKKPYVFKLAKGVHCFDHSKKLNLLATGAPDHMVRLWNPYVPNKPITVLEGHYSAVIDVVIYEYLEQVFSYSADAMLKVWDIRDYTCLQTVILKFPTSLHGHIPDHGSFPLHLNAVIGSPHSCLLVACNDYIAKLKLGLYHKPADDIPRTHYAPLCAAIYNQFFREVVTGADDSSLMCWDFETGNKNLVFTNAHGDEEITSMAFDGNWRRLITGARNGTVKVWNFQNGHNLHKLEPVDESEVTGVLSLVEKEYMLTVGWSRTITKYDDSEGDNLYIEADDSWKGGTLHRDDILDLAYCSPNLLATASFDGEILVWTLETEKLILRLDCTSNTGTKHAGNDRRRRSEVEDGERLSRPNSRHRQSHQPPPKGTVIPVDKILFLKHRIDSKLTEAAVLVSCQAGVTKWWSIFGNKNLLGEHRGTDFPTESVLATSCNEDNTTLVTADTQGFIYTWDITDYCIKPAQQVEKSRPPIRHLWRGHEQAVVSVEYIEHKDGDFILSASSDRMARLWSSDGKFIGTFGQQLEWNLADENTWIHPLNPFSEEYLLKELENSIAKKVSEEEQTENLEVEEEDDVFETGDGSILPEIDQHPTKEVAQVPVCKRQLASRAVTLSEIESIKSTWLESDLQIKERARTFHNMALQMPKTSLGVKAENELLRSRISRQQRRGNFGNVDKDLTNRFGVLCCPFQVLATQEMNNNVLPKHLPVTQRMIQRGYTSSSLDEAMLKTMDLSIIIEDDTESRKKVNKRPKPRLPSINSRSNTMVSTKLS